MYAVVDSSRTVRSCSADFARFCRAAEGALVGKALAGFYEAASAADVAASFSEAEATGKCVERRVAVSGARDRAACWVLQSVAVLLPSRDAMVRWEVLPDGSAAVDAVSTRLLAEALEALPRRVALLDHTGQMLYRNAEFDRDAGLARQQPVSFMTDGLLHPDDKQRVLLDWNKSVTAHEEAMYRSQYRMRHADKTFHLYDFAASPVKANGETLAWACSDVDIDSLVVGSKSVLESTQRILSALAVAEDYGAVRRAMLTELVRVSSSDLAYMCTVERGGVGAPMTFSRQRLVSFVYAPELPPNVFGSRCRPQEELPLDPLLAECVSTRSPRWLVLPDGQGPCFECKSSLPVSVLLLPMFGSDDRLLYIACLKRRSPDYDETIVNVLQPLIRVCSCVCDAFERAEKVQEEVSRKREQMLLQAMLDVTQEAVVVVLDESFVIQNINGPAETLFGFANDDLRGRSVARILLSEELSDLKLAELFTLVLASGRPHELVGRHKNGSSIMLNMTALRVRFKGSSAFALFFRSVASLKEQDKKKVELLARLSHDFRGPLNGIFGMLTLLKGCELEDRASTYVNACIKSAEGLLAVLNDVLLFSSLDAGTHSVHRAPFNLFTLIEDVLVAASSAVSSSHDLDVTYSIDEAVPQGLLLGDANNLRQVLMNIIGNAVKFTKYGEISLDVHVHSHDPLELRFVCTDTGKGIEPGVLEQLFKAFSQGEASGMAGGLGLGLATCKKLVSLMGGQIGATSRMGRGSTFWFTVPLEIAPSSLGLSAFDDSVDAQQLALLKGVRVLVVDDNATNCVLLESILSRVGCLCMSVRCGADAIEAVRTAHFRAEPFDVMLLDFHMPNMSGADVLRSVSALDVKKPKVVGLANVGHGGSSVFDRDLRSSGDEADQADVLGWVTKPFRRIELLRAVCNVLRTSESLLLAQTNALSGSGEPADFPSVLVVEDDENSAQALVHLLERMRCHVTRAATGIEALERMNDTFRVVLIDAHLPLMDGISVTRWVRSRFPALPVHVLTADVSPDLRRRCLEAGASFVHLKPITLSILTGIVRPLMTPSQWGSVLHGSSNLGELLSFSSPMKLERSGSNTSLLSPHRGGGDSTGATNLSGSPKKSELETRRSSGGSSMEGKMDAATATMKRKPSSQSDRAGADSTNNSGVGSSTSSVATGRAGSNAFNSSSASRPIIDDLLVPPGGESDYVLVVDDNTANRDVLMGLLKLFRCNVLEASSGVEALDRMSKHVALVIMDIHMPVMDGFDATLAMKKRWPNVPVVMLTADATAQTRKRSFDVGASEVMVKPTKSHALHECLKQYAPHLLTQKPATSSSSPPKVEAAAVAVGTAAAVAPPTKEISFRILIVDDVSTNRTLAEYAVKKVWQDAVVVLASNGEEAIEAVEKGDRFDLILMDVSMPKVSGITATRRIRKLQVSQPLIVGMTAFDDADSRRECLLAGMNRILLKPLRSGDLQDVLEILTPSQSNVRFHSSDRSRSSAPSLLQATGGLNGQQQLRRAFDMKDASPVLNAERRRSGEHAKLTSDAAGKSNSENNQNSERTMSKSSSSSGTMSTGSNQVGAAVVASANGSVRDDHARSERNAPPPPTRNIYDADASSQQKSDALPAASVQLSNGSAKFSEVVAAAPSGGGGVAATNVADADGVRNDTTVEGEAAEEDLLFDQSFIQDLPTDVTQMLLQSWKSSTLEILAELPALIESEEELKLQRAAHSLKGASAQIGAAQLSKVAASLEKLHPFSKDLAKKLLAKLRTLMDATTTAMGV